MRYFSLFILILAFSACGSKNQEVEKPKVEKENFKVPVQLNKDELAALIPKEILGYQPKNKAEGLDIKMKNAQFSFTTQTYFQKKDSITVELHDYLESPSQFDHYADLWWDGGTEEDTPELYTKYMTFGDGIDVWTLYEKKPKRSTVYAGVNHRYYLIFECFGKENSDFIVEAAKSFDYNALKAK